MLCSFALQNRLLDPEQVLTKDLGHALVVLVAILVFAFKLPPWSVDEEFLPAGCVSLRPGQHLAKLLPWTFESMGSVGEAHLF